MFEVKVPMDIAQAEVEAWLDYKAIYPSKRDENRNAIDTVVNAVMYGDAVIGDDKSISVTLKFPVGDTTVLTLKPRLTVGEVAAVTKNVKPNDIEGRMTAYISALTGVLTATLSKMDTVDSSLLQSVTVFFL